MRWLVPLSLVSLLVLGPARAAEIETATGPVSVPDQPAKIAVYDIAAIDTLDRLGIKIDGLPGKLYLSELEHLAAKGEPVGTLFEPDLEALNALAPDLVIVGGRSSPQAKATARVATTIDMSIGAETLLADATARLETYGRLFGREAEAAAAKAEFDAAVAEARAAVQGKGNALIVMTNGPKITAYGPGSRFGWVHAALGLTPAVANVEAATHGEAISFEFIRKADPDWLIVVDRAAAIGSEDQNARATLDNELVAQTKAWKSQQVVYLPASDIYIAAGGVQAMTRTLRAITSAFAKAP